MKDFIAVMMRDGSTWGVPVEEVARDRAANYADEFDDDVEKSLAEDTLPLFESDSYEVIDWAVNNMNWSDFKGARKLRDAPPLTKADFQDAWMSASKELVDEA